MPKNLRLILTFLPIFALLIALGYWNISPDSFDERPVSSTTNDIDFYVINPRSQQFEVDGKLSYEMQANKLEHDKRSDITRLDQPDMLLYRGQELPWHVQSLTGEVLPGGSQVELIDQVRVQRTDAKGRPTLLTTTRLSVFPDKEYAQTSQAVRIEAANGVTTAQGMKAYLNDGRLLLLSNVRGQHAVR